jgi:hypothetical protein
VEEDNHSRSAGKTSKKKNPTKKRKVNPEQDVMPVAAPESLQQMDKLSPRTVGIESYYGTQQSVQGMVIKHNIRSYYYLDTYVICFDMCFYRSS